MSESLFNSRGSDTKRIRLSETENNGSFIKPFAINEKSARLTLERPNYERIVE